MVYVRLTYPLSHVLSGSSHCPRFAGEEAKAQRGEVTRPRSHRWPGAEPGLQYG